MKYWAVWFAQRLRVAWIWVGCIAGLFAAVGCVDVGTAATSLELSVVGTEMSEPFEGRFGVPIHLDRASVAFGPLYLCAGTTAGTLCDEAVAEFGDAAVVDATSPEPVVIGEMLALDRVARSFMYDFGVVSRLTTPSDPLVTNAAQALGGSSVLVEGSAELDGQDVPFRVEATIAQSGEVEQGVPVVRSGESDGFEYRIRPDGTSRLLIQFDPRNWLRQADFSSLSEAAACSPQSARIICDGAVEQTCDAAGATMGTRDCRDTGQVCVRGRGCVDKVRFEADSQVARALARGLESGEPPEFIFESIQ